MAHIGIWLGVTAAVTVFSGVSLGNYTTGGWREGVAMSPYFLSSDPADDIMLPSLDADGDPQGGQTSSYEQFGHVCTGCDAGLNHGDEATYSYDAPPSYDERVDRVLDSDAEEFMEVGAPLASVKDRPEEISPEKAVAGSSQLAVAYQ